MQPAADEGLCRRLGFVPIALDTVGTTNQQFTYSRPIQRAVEFQVDDWRRKSDSLRPQPRILVGEKRRDGRTFRQPETVPDPRVGEGFEDARDQIGRSWGAPVA